jgi:hypothetical protein
MLAASAIMLGVTSAIFQVVNPARGTFQTQPESADLQQRLRVGVDSLTRELLMAGAGIDTGASAGPLHNVIAPVLPYRIGDSNNDPDAGVFFRKDAVTLLYVPATRSQTTIRNAIPRTASQLEVESQSNCPPATADQRCGFGQGMRALLFDSSGAWDLITITGVQGEALLFSYQGELAADYAAGATIAQAAMHTYYLKPDTRQLMHYDGASTDLPVIDDAVKLEFEYFGEPRPPDLLPGKEGSEARTTYGPAPPALGQGSPFGWPAGENCTFLVQSNPVRPNPRQPSRVPPDLLPSDAARSGQHAPRLAILGDGIGQVRLAPAMLTDGPWCPSAISARRFDADLLRIRRIRIVLRVQVASEALRGRGALFMRPGTSIGGERTVPDQEISFDITPRNLNLGR